MDLAEYRKLQQETESFRNRLDDTILEKTVLDRKYARLWQESAALEKDCLKKDAEIQRLLDEVRSQQDSVRLLGEQLAALKEKSVVANPGKILDPPGSQLV